MYDYEAETLAALREQLARVAEYDLYADLFAGSDVDPAGVETWDGFRALPFTGPDDLAADREAHPPRGSVAPAGAMLSFTPAGDDLAPVVDTAGDLAHQAAVDAAVLERAGVDPGDRVYNAFGYHLFGTGYVLHRGLEELGAEVVPAGPGDSEQAAATVETYDVDAFVGNPSFALKVGDHGATVDVVVGAGEPFTSVPGMRGRVKDALDAGTAVDYFGTRRIMPVAAECAGEAGLHVAEDYAVVEIVDPDTGEPLAAGERGEMVVTHVRKEGVPLVRYRTGDLAELSTEPCPTCGASVTLPDGVVGRTDERLKVKGVKVYPESLDTVLAGFPGLTGEYRVEVTRPDATDRLRVVCEAEAGAAVDGDALADAIGERLLVAPDAVEVTTALGESGVVDERF